jgi:hypothetical protein
MLVLTAAVVMVSITLLLHVRLEKMTKNLAR